jgi:hypothetical protein
LSVSQYFNNYGSLPEQRVIEDIIVESIKIQGFEAYYLPNINNEARDLLYGEDPVKHFQAAFQLELYLSNALEYAGEREFFSKFGLEIKNNVNVIVSKRTFSQRVPQKVETPNLQYGVVTRPQEGDLIYIPFLNGTGELFEIKFTNQTKDFFMLGRKVPYFYELELEKFKYSQEIIATGISDIDSVVTDSAYTLHLNVGEGIGFYDSQEIVYQAADMTQANATAVAIVQAWIPSSNTLSVTNIAGEFINNIPIVGTMSGAQYVLADFDPLADPAKKEVYDNLYINTSANEILDLSETNPFGSI